MKHNLQDSLSIRRSVWILAEVFLSLAVVFDEKRKQIQIQVHVVALSRLPYWTQICFLVVLNGASLLVYLMSDPR
jgi:hypothetical protein